MATSVQHRGETAVLGLGVESRHHLTAIPSLAQTSIPSSSSSAIPLRDSASLQEARLAARGIARRKLRRRENARLSANPHVARPSAIDYTLQHPNQHSSTFPLPSHLQHLRLPSRPILKRTSNNDSASSSAGRFTMTYADAHFFLAHRVGIRIGQECIEEEMGLLQAFAKRAEAEIEAWLHQDVFLASDLNAGSHHSILVDFNSQDDDRDFRIHQISKNSHNMVWQVSDAFLRLTIHCLARVLHCPTFSKDAPNGRQTWILHPRSGRGNMSSSLGHSMIDTPPITDIGTDVSEMESEWAMSEIEEDLSFTDEESGFEAIGDDDTESVVVIPYQIDEEDDSLADIEDE